MLLDCNGCPGRGTACGDCMVSVLLDPRPQLPTEVSRAIGVLQDAGLIGPVHLALIEPEPAGAPVGARVLPLHRRAG